MPNIGFIGLGNMGAPMAANLVKSGDRVVGFDLVAASRQAGADQGVAIASNAKATVEDADIVVTMLPAGEHVRSVWTDVLPSAKPGTLFIDCSTIDVTSARAAHALAAERGVAFGRARDLLRDLGALHDVERIDVGETAGEFHGVSRRKATKGRWRAALSRS